MSLLVSQAFSLVEVGPFLFFHFVFFYSSDFGCYLKELKSCGVIFKKCISIKQCKVKLNWYII